MTRIRQVFPREQVAHLWAHKAQDSARDAGGSFYFTGPNLYSYGSHFVIAHMLGNDAGPELSGRIVWNAASYSNTTSTHQSIAVRALTRQQRDNLLRVPAMTEDDARDIERATRDRKLPKMAENLVRTIRDAINGLSGKKHGSGPFCTLTHDARDYEKTALAFYARAGRKYPLPLVPADADIPADKTARDAFILTFSRAIIEEEYRDALAAANVALASARDAMMNPESVGYERHVIVGTYDTAQRCERLANDAAKRYATLNAGKKSAAAARILREVAPMLVEFKTRRDAYERAEMMSKLERFARMYYKTMRKTDRSGRLLGALTIPGKAQQALREAEALQVAPDSVIGVAVRRAARFDDVGVIDRSVVNLLSSFNAAESYGTKWPGDALRCYSEVAYYARQISMRIESTAYASHVLARPEVARMIVTAREQAEVMHAAIKAKHAETLRAWIAGESNARPPYEAGTYARINGNMIETTRGANVPIEHGCRLARLYAVAVRKGGASWPDGAGPMVGHYRVNVIGADGSLVIGCHEFDAAEGARLHALLASCDACAEVTETA